VVWRLLLLAVAAYLLAQLLTRLRFVVLPVVGALLIVTLLLPPAQWLKRRGWPAAAAAFTVLLGGLLAVAAVLYFIASRVAGQFGSLAGQVSESVDQIHHWLVNGPLHLSDQQLGDLLQRIQDTLSSRQGLIVSRALSTTGLALEVLGAAILTLLLTFFFLKDGQWMQAWLLGQVDTPTAPKLRAAGQEAWSTLTGYVRGVAIIGSFDAVFIGIGLAVVGVPLVLSLALLTFLGAFLPLVGAFTAGLISALVALVSKGPVAAGVVVGITLVVQQVEGHVLQPAVMSRAVRLHPVVILLSLGAGGVLGGIVGAFLAVPAVAVATAAVGAWRRATAPHAPAAERRAPVEPPKARAGSGQPDSGESVTPSRPSGRAVD
jgi:predicted PurR-regulated permease PerM